MPWLRQLPRWGVFTDLGISLGHILRGLPIDRLRLYVCIVVATSFLLGSTAGALLFSRMQEHALLIPAVLTGICGLGYGVYRQKLRPGQDRGRSQKESLRPP